jgi:ferredoxin
VEKERAMRIVIDAERCTGHGRCYSLAPDVFEPDDVGHSLLLSEEIAPGLEAHARLGAENCPEHAITVVE